MSPEPQLLDVGRRIADGLPIDWTAVQSSGGDDSDPLVAELRSVADIAAAHRTLCWHGPDPGEATQEWSEEWEHLKLVEKIGWGAYGEVYRAWDTRLNREVALKLLRAPQPEHADSAAVDEGSMLARVRHPNVVTVFGAARLGNEAGIWMEFIRGRTLDEILRERGVFGAREAMLVGIDLCRALSAVHAAGLLHRDVKAQNVMREAGGRIVLMDFGTVRDRRDPAPSADVAGTPLYLAPELLDGRPAAPPSDLYSLGVLLFRLVTNQFPVSGRSMAEIKLAHAGGQRTLLRDLRPDLPGEFVDVVERALSPDAAARFQSAGAMEQALRRALEVTPDRARPGRTRASARVRGLLVGIAAAAALAAGVMGVRNVLTPRPPVAAASIQSIAVLPFVNQSGDASQEYVADGVTDVLIANLANIGSLRITSRTSVVQYKNTTTPLPEIARALGVDAIVEGAVASTGDRVRLTVRLVRAASDALIWSQSYDRTVTDMLAFQGEIAHAIATAVSVSLTADEQQRLTAVRPVAPAAQEAYLRGRYELNGYTVDHIESAVRFLTSAVEIEPTYALAWADLADAYVRLSNNSTALARDESVSRARAAALRALELDSSLALAHTTLGRAQFYFDWDWRGAADSFARALQTNPSNAGARQHYAYFLAARGDLPAAVEQSRLARDLDPLAPVRSTSLAAILYYARRYDDALTELQRALQLDPSFGVAHFGRGRTLAAAGFVDEAIDALNRAIEQGRDAGRVAELARVYAQAGRRADATRLLAELENGTAFSSRISPDALAYIYIALGVHDRALSLLETAADQRAAGLLWLRVDPRVDAIRSEPRFATLIARIGLAP